VEIARRLVVGSLRASFEQQKDIYYESEDGQGNALFRVLDGSQPWWTEKDIWGRWKKVSLSENSANDSFAPIRLGKDNFGVRLASTNGQIDRSVIQPSIPLSQVIYNFANDAKKETEQSQLRIVAM
jgi:hypothetical protein